ncbi:MAG: cellulase family glycosylhydrolase [Thermoproteota archaeon]
MMERIYVRGKNFTDEAGRTRIFHGVNLVCKDKSKRYVNGWNRFDFEELSRLGFNLVRLGLFWDGVEPEPGKYDEDYLDRIEVLLDMCADYGIYVLLDMHQDLYSVLYSDGAPEWATFTDGLPEPEGGLVWSDAYLNSEAVQRAFDHFWSNDPALDAVGLQDHFSRCWQYIAQRFGSRHEVLGYDIFNEPFPGTAATPILHALITAFSSIESRVSGKPPRSIKEASAMFFDNEGRFEALRLLDDKHLYKSFVSAAESSVVEFDVKILIPFYERVAAAIRSVASNGILFMENNYFSNIGVPSGLQPIAFSGRYERLQAFAPHGYDLVVDTPFYELMASENRAGVIFENHRATQQRLNMPVVVGEWGGFGAHENIIRHCLFLLDLFDKYGWSFTYWAWRRGESRSYVTARLLARDYPKAIAGNLTYFKYDYITDSFFMEWEADGSVNAPTVICLPGGLNGRQVKIFPSSSCNFEDINGTMHLMIKSLRNGRHILTIE